MIAVAVVLFGAGCAKFATPPAASPSSVTATPAAPLAPPNLTPRNATSTMRLTSKAFKHGKAIPAKYTCDGRNISPPLAISEVPSSTKSLVLIMDDPDVPSYAGVKAWDHWIVFDMPPDTKIIAEGKQPLGTRGAGTGGGLTYGGPCPSDREHRYFFKLYALDALLDLPQSATKADVERAMSDHVIEQTELVGTYLKKQVKK